MRLRNALHGLWALFFLGLPVWAQSPVPPDGPVVLAVSGLIDEGEYREGAWFDRAALEALAWADLETHTAFTDGPQRFEGPRVADLLDAVGASGTQLHLVALNDYAITLPIEMLVEEGAIFALLHNGKPMRIRDRGPIWLVIPATEAEAAGRKWFAESIWQLATIRVD